MKSERNVVIKNRMEQSFWNNLSINFRGFVLQVAQPEGIQRARPRFGQRQLLNLLKLYLELLWTQWGMMLMRWPGTPQSRKMVHH